MKLKFPKTIKIGPFDYKILSWPEYEGKSAGRYGECDHTLLEMKIRDDLPEQRQKETFLHELIHGCWHVGEIDDANEEKAVSILSLQLLSMFKNNPKLKDVFFG